MLAAELLDFLAVSRRRLDVRGAVSVRVQITGERMQEVISDVFGMQVQCQKQTIAYASQKQRAVKTISSICSMSMIWLYGSVNCMDSGSVCSSDVLQ